MTKPILLLEVEQALAAANEAEAEFEAFDKANPQLHDKLTAQYEVLGDISRALGRQALNSSEVKSSLKQAHYKQRQTTDALHKIWVARGVLKQKVFDTGRAYVHASHKWDGSAERLDYLMALGRALNQEQE